MTFQELFGLGMKRFLPDLITCDGPAFDVGASGKYVAPGAVGIGAPDWTWPRDPIPASDDTVATIHCYHFLEHLSGDDAIAFMREVERVLIPDRGVMNFSIPYYASTLAVQNLQHRSFWCEESFRNLFEDKTYHHSGDWKLSVHFMLIAGVVERNLAVVGQIIKAPPVDRPKWHYPS